MICRKIILHFMQRNFFFTLLLLFAMVFVATDASAIPGKEKKALRKARKHLSLGKYSDAKKAYDKLIRLNSDCSNYWFEAGLAYYHSDIDKEKSVYYFEQARLFRNKKNGIITFGDTIGEVFFFLGRTYQFMSRFEEAIAAYKTFRNFIQQNKPGNSLNRDVSLYIAQCKNGIKLAAETHKNITVKSLGKKVNTQWSEYAPVINKEQTVLIFTARHAKNKGKKKYIDNRKYEDIWVSMMKNGEWSAATQFDASRKYTSDKINTRHHNAALAYNHDETILYTYRLNDIWKSQRYQGKWGTPVRMNNYINTKSHEPSVFINPSETTLFVVSDREGGTGKNNRDIYFSKKQEDGSWGPVRNLGPPINTEFDEDAPFLSENDSTFYFSSNGRNSIGGYDIFKTTCDENGNWSTPVNMGMPVNTPGDDIYYVEKEGQGMAYLSSSRPYGEGHMDLYQVVMECEPIPNVEIRGLLVHEESLQPISGRILVTNNESGENVGEYNVDADGKYLLDLPPGRSYHIKVEAGNYLPHNADIVIPKQCEYYQLFQEIHIKYLKDASIQNLSLQKAVFRNAFFDVKKETEALYHLEDIRHAVVYDPEDQFISLVATVNHSLSNPSEKVNLWLLNQKNEIIRTAGTTADGVAKFSGLNPDGRYKILIDKTTLNSDSSDVLALGDVFYDRINGEPVPDFPVYLANHDMKVTAVQFTDDAGHWQMNHTASPNLYVEDINQAHPFGYNLELTDVDQLYSSYIRSIDTAHTDLAYSEVEDLISMEDIELWLLNNPHPKTNDKSIHFENILFDFDRYSLRATSKEVLNKVVAYMKEHPEAHLDITGHTDWKGNDAYNIKLSKKRTYSAYDYLLKNGIEPHRLNTGWHGESKPTAANANPDGSDNPEGRQLNRRVEFRMSNPNMPGFSSLL